VSSVRIAASGFYSFSHILALAYVLWKISGADGGADGGGQGLRPLCDVFGVLGFDHDARFGFSARVANDDPAGGAQ
jgi:hypothetical protein